MFRLLKISAARIHALSQRVVKNFRRMFIKITPIPSYEKAIRLFKRNPERYFYNGDQRVSWPKLIRHMGINNHSAEYIQIRVRGRVIGYISHTLSFQNNEVFQIGHFAVSLEVVGTGVATIMANVMRKRLRAHYNTHTIVFHENHQHFSARNYTAFFNRIGAINPDPNKPRRWVWDISQIPD
jgi:hypothetical protein